MTEPYAAAQGSLEAALTNGQQTREPSGLLPAATFVLALAFGTYLIGQNVWQPWSSPALVAVYGVFLFSNRRRIALTGEVKDSAYYLGFSFNLLFLFFAFRRAGLLSSGAGAPAQHLVEALGSAIAATVVGLVVRYALYVVDDDDLVQKQAFSEIQAEVKKSIAGFRQTQRVLLSSISSFLDARQRLAEQEDIASRKYVANLDELLTELRTLQIEHIEVLTKSVKAIEPTADSVLTQLRGFAAELGVVRKSLDAPQLSSMLSSLSSSIASLGPAAGGTQESLTALTAKVQELRAELTHVAGAGPAMRADLQAIDAILTDFTDVLESRVSALK